MEHAARLMAPRAAAEVIRGNVDARKPLTISDVAAKTGLALRDAESGLTWLSSEFRGQLRVTADGDLVHIFATGFAKPWETRDAAARFFRAIGKAAIGVLRFVVRAWVTVVLLGYAAIFIALLIGLAFAQQGGDSRSRDRGGFPGGALFYVFFRIIGDALFWTFHPFSPFSVYYASPGLGVPASSRGWRESRRLREEREEPKVPLYERVNRFFFGPAPAPADPRENERLVLAAIRAGKGRIGLADVMRVTGLPRELADPMMARLMLDYEGDVDVSEDGGIVYRFEKIRRTAGDVHEPEPAPAWTRIKSLPPLTGNTGGANFLIAALNAFNLAMGWWAIQNGMTIERITHLFDRVPYPLTDMGTPIALGIVPLVFSGLLFLLPIGRAIARPMRAKRATEEQGRLAVLRTVLERIRSKQPVTDEAVVAAWKSATGQPPPSKRVDRELVALGGDVEIQPSGTTRWRFADLETEAKAVEAERDAAAEEEARLGEIVYATDRN